MIGFVLGASTPLRRLCKRLAQGAQAHPPPGPHDVRTPPVPPPPARPASQHKASPLGDAPYMTRSSLRRSSVGRRRHAGWGEGGETCAVGLARCMRSGASAREWPQAKRSRGPACERSMCMLVHPCPHTPGSAAANGAAGCKQSSQDGHAAQPAAASAPPPLQPRVCWAHPPRLLFATGASTAPSRAGTAALSRVNMPTPTT